MSSAPTLQSPLSQEAETAKKDSVQTRLEDGPARALAYAARLRTFAIASSRYVAFTSEVGEAIRPLVSPAVVRAAYGISWAYIFGDVGYAGYRTWKTGGIEHAHDHPPNTNTSTASAVASALPDKDELRKRLANVNSTSNAKDAAKELSKETSQALSIVTTPIGGPSAGAPPSEVAFVMARRAVFQTIASMALPAFTIHSVVRYSAPLFARSASRRLASLGPTISGLACVPALPYLFDHPVENVVDYVFDRIQGFVLPSSPRRLEDAVREHKEKAAEQVKKNI
ncbi:hypothetical protein V8E36_007670 [Tilletia maclaganii]